MIKVYLAKPVEICVDAHILPDERKNYINNTANKELAELRYSVWKLLERAACDGLGIGFKDLSFSVDDKGKWSCDKFFFSLSHTGGAVAVAISDSPVGVDIESISSFEKRCQSDVGFCSSLAKKLKAEGGDSLGVLKEWTGSESAFKRGGFANVLNVTLGGLPIAWARCGDLLAAVCGDGAADAWYFVCESGKGEYPKGSRIFPEISD